MAAAIAEHFEADAARARGTLDYAAVEEVGEELWERRTEWRTMRPNFGPAPVMAASRWRSCERPILKS